MSHCAALVKLTKLQPAKKMKQRSSMVLRVKEVENTFTSFFMEKVVLGF